MYHVLADPWDKSGFMISFSMVAEPGRPLMVSHPCYSKDITSVGRDKKSDCTHDLLFNPLSNLSFLYDTLIIQV